MIGRDGWGTDCHERVDEGGLSVARGEMVVGSVVGVGSGILGPGGAFAAGVKESLGPDMFPCARGSFDMLWKNECSISVQTRPGLRVSRKVQ